MANVSLSAGLASSVSPRTKAFLEPDSTCPVKGRYRAARKRIVAHALVHYGAGSVDAGMRADQLAALLQLLDAETEHLDAGVKRRGEAQVRLAHLLPLAADMAAEVSAKINRERMPAPTLVHTAGGAA